MHRVIQGSLCALAVMLMAGVAATAVAGGKTHDQLSTSETPDTTAAPTGARLAALISPTYPGFRLRSYRVASVSNPSKGTYCIEPAPKAGIIGFGHITPVATVDYSNSGIDNSLVQFRSSGDGCPKKTIAMLTFVQNGSGGVELSDAVAFTVVVP